jgi:hypothetical protein
MGPSTDLHDAEKFFILPEVETHSIVVRCTNTVITVPPYLHAFTGVELF